MMRTLASALLAGSLLAGCGGGGGGGGDSPRTSGPAVNVFVAAVNAIITVTNDTDEPREPTAIANASDDTEEPAPVATPN